MCDVASVLGLNNKTNRPMVEQYSGVSLVLGVLFVPKYDTYAALLLVSFSYLGELSILGHFNETLPRIPYVGTKKYTQVY